MKFGIELEPGLVSDDTPYSTQGSFRNADKVRFNKGKPEVVKGFEKVTDDVLPGVCRTILSWKDNAGHAHIAFGTHSALLIYKNGKLVDITPDGYLTGNINGGTGLGFGTGPYGGGPYGQISATSVDYGPRIWSLVNFGQALIASPRLGEIYLWENDMTAKATLLSAAAGATDVPVKTNVVLFTKERQVLAFGTNELISGDFNPLAIRGSDIDGNYQDWSITSANNAFEDILPSGGSIVGAKVWADNIAVWTQSGMFSGSFIGDASQTYRWDAVDGAVGLLGPNAALVVGQTVFWVSPDLQVWSCAAGGVPAQLVCPILDDSLKFVAENQGDKVNLSFTPSANEIRIDYPDSRDGLENSRFVSLSLNEGAWSRGTQSRTAFERGTAFLYPLGAQAFERDLVYPVEVVDNATAQDALDAITAALSLGSNTVSQSDATSSLGGALVTNSVMTWGSSGWGLRFTGDGSTTLRGKVAGLSLTLADKISVSYKAYVKVGPNATMSFQLYHSTGTPGADLTQSVAITASQQTFTHENITVSDAADFVYFNFTGLGAGTVVEITDIKVEVRTTATAWSPARDDSNLFVSHYDWLTTTVYPQHVSDSYYHEKGFDADGGELDWMLETNDFSLDEDETAMLIRGFIPDFKEQQGTVNLTIYLRMYPQEVEEVYGPYPIDPTTTNVDFMATGKIARFRIEGSSAPAALRLGRPVFDAVPAGRR